MTDLTSAPKTVLIVEDNAVEREGLSAVLQHEGYCSISAANGKEALEHLRGQPTPDAMLLDMMMSELDGWQLLGLLRHYPSLVKIPVIIVTGLAIATDEWARSLGASGLVHKPVDVEQLVQQLSDALSK